MRVAADSLDWTVSSPETLLDVPTTSAPVSAQFAMGADPTGFLLSSIGTRGIIEATHVSNSGVVSSPFGTILSSGSTRTLNWSFPPPVPVAFNGDHYLVAWMKFVPDPNSIYSSDTVASESTPCECLRVVSCWTPRRSWSRR